MKRGDPSKQLEIGNQGNSRRRYEISELFLVLSYFPESKTKYRSNVK